MSNNCRIVEVYDKVVTYRFEENQAFRTTANGATVPIDFNTALSEVERFKERDGRHYRHNSEASHNETYMWLSLLGFAVAGVAIFFLWLSW